MQADHRAAAKVRWLLPSAALACGACSYALAGDPLFGTVQNVAQGGCVAQCSPGWRCNPEAKVCEREAPDAGVLGFTAAGDR